MITCPGTDIKARSKQECPQKNCPSALGTNIEITCTDGSTVECRAGSMGCYDRSPMYCSPKPGGDHTIKCKDGTTVKCASGTMGCYDDSPELCKIDLGSYDYIMCDGYHEKIKCASGTAGCYDNSPLLCPAPSPSNPVPPATKPAPTPASTSNTCLASAGYTWCESKQKCLRVWEEPCCDINQMNFDDNTRKDLKIERCVADVFDGSFFDTCVSYMASGSSTGGTAMAGCASSDFEKTCRELQDKMTIGMAKDYCTNMTDANDLWWSKHIK